MPCWIDIAEPDVDAALAFYGGLLGWEFEGPGPMAGDPQGRYYVAKLRGRDVAGISTLPPGVGQDAAGISTVPPGVGQDAAGISTPPPGVQAPPAWTTHVAVESADEAADRARAAGGTVVVEPFDAAPAGRMAVLRDPAGAVFGVWQAYARVGAQLVNEPSAWAMSLLSTSDPAAESAFYAAVLGWRTESFGPDMSLFRLPGYVGGEAGQPVPRDVVAGMAAADQAAAWNVNLWVKDADATAAQAQALGGRVIVAPREEHGFRNTVIADPHGAVLSASQLLAPH